MTTHNLYSIFEKHSDDYLKFSDIENPPSQRPDLCAMILLDRLIPGKRDIIVQAEHDEFTLGIDPDVLASVATEEQIVDLIRCGVRYSSSIECLQMFT